MRSMATITLEELVEQTTPRPRCTSLRGCVSQSLVALPVLAWLLALVRGLAVVRPFLALSQPCRWLRLPLLEAAAHALLHPPVLHFVPPPLLGRPQPRPLSRQEPPLQHSPRRRL